MNMLKQVIKRENLAKNVITAIPILLLLLAIKGGMPRWFYLLLRCTVCGTTAFLALLSYAAEKKLWVCIFGLIAIVFNPFRPLYLGRSIWQIADIIVVVVLVISMISLGSPPKNKAVYHENVQIEPRDDDILSDI